jgi:hypothetical protein
VPQIAEDGKYPPDAHGNCEYTKYADADRPEMVLQLGMWEARYKGLHEAFRFEKLHKVTFA